jgi:hypothetical protein
MDAHKVALKEIARCSKAEDKVNHYGMHWFTVFDLKDVSRIT